MLEGLSLSFCIKDVIKGNIDARSISQIITSTCCSTEDEFKQVLEVYARTYWRKNPELGKALAWRLWKGGKIVQPRLLQRKDDLENSIDRSNGYWRAV